MATYHQFENIVAEQRNPNPTSLALPNGMEFHVIFAYEKTDRDWVIKYLEKLEGDLYQFRCCFDDRDFMPSKEVLSNIGDLMKQSMAAIFVISPEHTASDYCDFEANVAFQLKRENKLRIIPVLRRGDDKTVPLGFRFINYIDARPGVNEEKVLTKLVKAIKRGPDRVEPTLCEELAPIPPDLNGTSMFITSRDGEGCCIGRWAEVFEEVDEHHLRRCESMGCKIPKHVLEDIRALMNDSNFLRAYRLIHRWCGLCFVMLIASCVMCGVPLLVASVMFALLGKEDNENSVKYTYVSVGLVIPVVACVLVVWRAFKFSNRFLSASTERAGLISQHLYEQYNVLVIFNNDHNVLAPCLQICKYNVEDCEDFVAGLLRRNDNCTDVTPDEIEQNSKRVVHDAIPSYLRLLSRGQPQAASTRHRVLGNVICLCQYVEISNLHIQNTTEAILPETVGSTSNRGPRQRHRQRTDDSDTFILVEHEVSSEC